jgi:hypothetical protein
MNETNTLIIDDNESTFQLNPKNAIYIPAYEPGLNLVEMKREDRALLDIMEWLKTPAVLNSNSVITLNKQLWD